MPSAASSPRKSRPFDLLQVAFVATAAGSGAGPRGNCEAGRAFQEEAHLFHARARGGLPRANDVRISFLSPSQLGQGGWMLLAAYTVPDTA